MTKVKVVGAGSIGNHLSHAARRKGWSVAICDIDPAAVERTRTQIYPSRYGAWDESIALYSSDEAPRGGFDYIFVGTPPDSHMALALAALDEKPRAILIEKPLAGADLAGCQELYEKSRGSGTRLFVGYDHVVAKSLTYLASEAANGIGPVETIDVFFREHWQGIFNAHPWLSGPADTYLGYWQRGGGALGEHSHAVNMWQHLAHAVGAGRVTKVTSALDYIKHGKAEYDRIAHLTFETEMGLVGHVIQDVVTRPPLKWARVQGTDKAIEWQCRPQPYSDIVRVLTATSAEETVYHKTRADDFIQELDHIDGVLVSGASSPIAIERGLETMLVIAAGHKSAREGRRVIIDYNSKLTLDALSCA